MLIELINIIPEINTLNATFVRKDDVKLLELIYYPADDEYVAKRGKWIIEITVNVFGRTDWSLVFNTRKEALEFINNNFR